MSNQKPKPGNAKKAHIVAIAREFIAENGDEALNMKAFAGLSGVPRPTLYRYFPSKERLVSEVALQWGLDFRERRGV